MEKPRDHDTLTEDRPDDQWVISTFPLATQSYVDSSTGKHMVFLATAVEVELANKKTIIEEERAKIGALQKEKRNLVDLFEEKYQKWTQTEQSLQREIEHIKEDNHSGIDEEMKSLTSQVEEKENQLSRVSRDFENERTISSGLRARWKKAQDKLENLMGIVGLRNIDSGCSDQLRDLQQSLKALACKYSAEYSGSQGMDQTGYAQWQRPPWAQTPLLPLSAQSPDRAIREFAIQALVAERLCKDIFQPICMRSPSGILSMGQSLQRSVALSQEQRAVLRSLLYKAFASEEGIARREIVTMIASDITDSLAPNLSTRETFHTELCAFLESANKVWMTLHASSDWVVATTDVGHSPESWSPARGSTESAFPVVSLFPQIICGNNKLLLGGLAVWSNDPVFKATDEAATRPVERKPSIPLSPSNIPTAVARREDSVSDKPPSSVRSAPRRIPKMPELGRPCSGMARPS
ncbi:hypothetical protein FE257_005505 [Aspergillus nanangensis]|uniref:Uncharacterized protein n=1 Tax=Aspergillus nanangensis TaxID=2582783 RepID=A0AAD4CA83_ASPNN|nr:hypothetical protein FE257_005505 [Aspergillus nanangensis]